MANKRIEYINKPFKVTETEKVKTVSNSYMIYFLSILVVVGVLLAVWIIKQPEASTYYPTIRDTIPPTGMFFAPPDSKPISFLIKAPEKKWYDYPFFTVSLGAIIGFLFSLIIMILNNKRADKKEIKEREYTMIKDLSLIKAEADGLIHTLINQAFAGNLIHYQLRVYTITDQQRKEMNDKFDKYLNEFSESLSKFISYVSKFGGLARLDKMFAPFVIELRKYNLDILETKTRDNSLIDKLTLEEKIYELVFVRLVLKLVEIMEQEIDKRKKNFNY